MGGSARVIVIGGGIVGCSILYHLAKQGCTDALLIERAELTSGATWHAAGNVHTQSAYRALSSLQAYSIKLYEGLAAEVGQEVGSHLCGGVFLAQTKDRMEEYKHLAGKFRAIGEQYDLITPQEIAALHPLVNLDGVIGGAWNPDEGYVDPYSVTMGLAAGARQRGARIERGHRVDRIDRRESGWRLSAGEEFWDCEIVVNAGGFWANEVAELVGARLPITNMEHHYLVTETIPDVRDHPTELPLIRDNEARFYMRQEADGLLLGPWEQDCRIAWNGETAPWSFGMELFQDDLDRMEDELAMAFHRIPVLNDAGIRRVVNGAISFSPDGRPMIGPMPGVPNFYVAAGFLGGITQAGGVGLALSQWMLEGETEWDLSFMDVARFGDWTTRDFAQARTREIFPQRYEIIYPQLERQTGRDIRKSPLHDALVARRAVMGQVNGWERPLWFAPDGISPKDEPSFSRPNWFAPVGDECRAVANHVALIDMSAYSKFEVSGPEAEAFLNHVVSATVPKTSERISVGLILSEAGGIVGDVTVCRLANDGAEPVFRLTGATAAERIYHRWFERHITTFDATLRCVTEEFGILGVVGPRSRDLLRAVGVDDVVTDAFSFLGARHITIGDVEILAQRVSFVGELGWELHCRAEAVPAVFAALMEGDTSLRPVLVGARAVGNLRLEKGYRSWGAELTSEYTPSVAGLEKLCSPTKSYIGRDKVEAERQAPPDRQLVTLAVSALDADCWGSEPVLRDGAIVGTVTSGGYGWRVDQSLCIADVPRALATVGTTLTVTILEVDRPAVVVADSVFDPKNARLKG